MCVLCSQHNSAPPCPGSTWENRKECLAKGGVPRSRVHSSTWLHDFRYGHSMPNTVIFTVKLHRSFFNMLGHDHITSLCLFMLSACDSLIAQCWYPLGQIPTGEQRQKVIVCQRWYEENLSPWLEYRPAPWTMMSEVWCTMAFWSLLSPSWPVQKYAPLPGQALAPGGSVTKVCLPRRSCHDRPGVPVLALFPALPGSKFWIQDFRSGVIGTLFHYHKFSHSTMSSKTSRIISHLAKN